MKTTRTHRTLMRFLPRMPPHMHDQHVLSFERLFIPGASHPAAYESLFTGVDVVRVDVLYQIILCGELQLAINLEKEMGNLAIIQSLIARNLNQENIDSNV